MASVNSLAERLAQTTVDEYVDGVLGGRIVTGRLVRLAVERYVRDLETADARGLVFDVKKAEKAARFFRYLKHSKGEWAGKELVLSPWQQFVTWNLFGWYRETPEGLRRRFKKVYVEVARKNGKSTWAAGIGLYLAFADDEVGAEVYAAATKKDQARIVHGEAMRMVKASPSLTSYLTCLKDVIVRESRHQKFEPLGADEDTMDGLNVSGAIIDEVHAHKHYGVWDKIETAIGARRHPVIFAITTAGFDRATLCWALHEYAEQILTGNVQDESFLAYIATLDAGDAWQDPEVWSKSNPNLGVSVKVEHLSELAQKAARLPGFQNAFLRLHLNVWTRQTKRWIDMELWDENAGPPVRDDEFLGRACYGGLDLSSVSDMTAYVLGFEDVFDEDLFTVRCQFWCPEARLYDETNKYREQYQAWHAQGLLRITPGNAIDYEFIKAEILASAAKFEVRELAVDRLFQGYHLSMQLMDEGMVVVGMGMGFASMAGPMKELNRLLLLRKLRHGGHPILRWMASNCAVREDPAGNLKPDKAESQGKIDGIIAILCALDRKMRGGQRQSVYERRGLLAMGQSPGDKEGVGHGTH
jgi:phage terminase large subunit-like protein